MSNPAEKDQSNANQNNGQPDNSQVTDSDKNGQSDNSGSQQQNKDQNQDSNDDSYKKRYADSSKEAQRLAADLKKYEDRYGKLEEGDNNGQNDDEDDGEDNEGDSDDKGGSSDNDDKSGSGDQSDLSDVEENPIRVKGVSEQTAMDIVWDRFAEKNAAVLRLKPEKMQEVATEFHRFTKDGAGNAVPYKTALQNAFKYVYSDVILERERKQAADQALIDAAKSGEGRLDTDSGRSSNNSSNIKLTPAEKNAAKKMGISEEKYAARKSENTNQ